MNLKTRVERLEHTNGNGNADTWLHVVSTLPDGRMLMRKLNGEPVTVERHEFDAIAARYGRLHPFIVFGKGQIVTPEGLVNEEH